ncbi:MAG: hypothetical protein QXD27_07770 [Metallosphaera sp.]
MQRGLKTLIFGKALGLMLIGLVASLTVSYTATRDVNAFVVTDPSANIALISNNTVGWSSTAIPFVSYNGSGDLQINFGNVATHATEQLLYAFDVENNLNTTATITITITPVSVPSGTNVYILTPTPVTTYTFTLGPGAMTPISLELVTGGSAGTATFSMSITVVAS